MELQHFIFLYFWLTCTQQVVVSKFRYIAVLSVMSFFFLVFGNEFFRIQDLDISFSRIQNHIRDTFYENRLSVFRVIISNVFGVGFGITCQNQFAWFRDLDIYLSPAQISIGGKFCEIVTIVFEIFLTTKIHCSCYIYYISLMCFWLHEMFS